MALSPTQVKHKQEINGIRGVCSQKVTILVALPINNGFSELTVGLEQNGEQNNHDTLKKFIKKTCLLKQLTPHLVIMGVSEYNVMYR